MSNMLSETFNVRFYETDALKHVSNTVVVAWFESARDPIFRMFTPELDVENWPLILASYHVDLLNQIFYGSPVEIKSGITRIGNSSFEIYQEVIQKGQVCAKGKTVMVHFDYNAQRSVAIPSDVKEMLKHIQVD